MTETAAKKPGRGGKRPGAGAPLSVCGEPSVALKFRMAPQTHARLVAIAVLRGVTLSEVVREAMTQYLQAELKDGHASDPGPPG